MANGLNVRLVNNVSDIAQGDTASTVIVELLDENDLVIPTLNGEKALINFINKKNEITYQFSTFIFDSRVEFNIDTVIEIGVYYVEIQVNAQDKAYVFPSNTAYKLRVNKSSNNYYNTSISIDSIEVTTNAVYQKIDSENPKLLKHTEDIDNPHEVTKNQVGLGKVDDIKQATKTEFDTHNADKVKHITAAERTTWNGKVDKVAGKVLSSNDYTNAEKTKLTAIEAGAQVNEVTSVNDKTGEVNVTKSDVGLGNVGNYGVATQAEAEAGTSSSKYMTPLRTKQAIDELAPVGGGTDFEDLSSLIVANNEVNLYEESTKVYRDGKLLYIFVTFKTTIELTPGKIIFDLDLPNYSTLGILGKGLNYTDSSDILVYPNYYEGSLSIAGMTAIPTENVCQFSIILPLISI